MMNRKKIDDTILLSMIEQGKHQNEVAEHFGVSPAAICKRLKRLTPPPESVAKLTEKEQNFCVEKAKGKSNTQAALATYECGSMASAKAIGHQLMQRPEIRTAIDDLMDAEGLTKKYRIRKLKAHVDHTDPMVSLKGLDMSFRLDGSYAPEKHDVRSENISAQLELTEQAYRNMLLQRYGAPKAIDATQHESIDEI